MLELGVSPMAILAILDASSTARGKSKKLATDDVLDVAKHQSVLEEELREHRAELERLRLSREEFPADMCCAITCELMKDPFHSRLRFRPTISGHYDQIRPTRACPPSRGQIRRRRGC